MIKIFQIFLKKYSKNQISNAIVLKNVMEEIIKDIVYLKKNYVVLISHIMTIVMINVHLGQKLKILQKNAKISLALYIILHKMVAYLICLKDIF